MSWRSFSMRVEKRWQALEVKMMHYHIMKNEAFSPKRVPQWSYGPYFKVLPQVMGKELRTSTTDCTFRVGLLVAKLSDLGNKTEQVLVNNNGRARYFTGQQLASFLETCRKKGDSLSLDDMLSNDMLGSEIERRLSRLFGEDGYVLSSASVPDALYLRSLMPQAPRTQQRVQA